MEDLKHTMDQYEKNVNDQKKQNKEIKSIIGHMDRILDSAAEMADESCTGNDELAADWENQYQNRISMSNTDTLVTIINETSQISNSFL